MSLMSIEISYDGEKWWTWKVDNDARFTRWYEVLAQGREKTEEAAVAKAKAWVAHQQDLDSKKKFYKIEV
jgi:hypothetical protein